MPYVSSTVYGPKPDMRLFHLFIEYFDKGGSLMWPIFGVSLVAWFLGVDKLLFLRRLQGLRKQWLASIDAIAAANGNLSQQKTGVSFEPFENFMRHLRELSTGPDEVRIHHVATRLLYREMLIGAVPRIERGFSTMSAWISVAPLLGLLGTVSGMIQTFRVITDYGLGNPNLTAEGISVALLTTQAGLTVAFPMMLFHNYLRNNAKGFINRLMMDGEKIVRDFSAGTADNGVNDTPAIHCRQPDCT